MRSCRSSYLAILCRVVALGDAVPTIVAEFNPRRRLAVAQGRATYAMIDSLVPRRRRAVFGARGTRRWCAVDVLLDDWPPGCGEARVGPPARALGLSVLFSLLTLWVAIASSYWTGLPLDFRGYPERPDVPRRSIVAMKRSGVVAAVPNLRG